MACTSPLIIRNPHPELGNRKSFGLEVPCGKCTACRIQRSREWATRLIHEKQYHSEASFVTLTYKDEYLPRGGSLEKRDFQLFMKRFRKALEPKKVKYYACGEYGEKKRRPHYHFIVFGFDDPLAYWDPLLKALRSPFLEPIWGKGNVTTGTVTYDSCRYVSDYIGKSYSGPLAEKVYGERERPFQLQSNGLGKRFALDTKDKIIMDEGLKMRGVHVGLPRYYKKVLELDPEMFRAKAEEHSKEVEEHYNAKGIYSEAELAEAIYQARKQHDKNVTAEKKLYGRDRF